MATNETGVTTEEATTGVVLKRNSDDVGWKYGVLVDPLNKEKVRCKFYGHTSSAGIYRLKQHVARVGTSVIKCTKQTPEEKAECKKSLDEASRKRKEKTVHDLNLREEVNVSKVREEDEVTCAGTLGSNVGSSEPQIGPNG
ncbi:hypothetical protein QOZ80_8AG0621510 [Eleusine coracana subsp. coracana]|nr:hypothetical protein QOZ80_8AG0621510 [Eleusine coracana subsp. coracana]